MKSVHIIAFFLFAISSTVFSQKKIEKKIEALTLAWAEASDAHDVYTLRPMYSSELLFYATRKERESCLWEKVKFFHLHKEYSINVSSISVEFYQNGTIKSSFIKKESWIGNTNKPVLAYLLFEKKEDKYFIAGESDVSIDSQHAYTLMLGPRQRNKNLSFYIFIAIAISAALLIAFWLRSKRTSSLHQLGIPVSSFSQELFIETATHKNKWA